MKFIKLSLAAAVIASSLAADAITVSGDVTFTSNALWRGATTTNDTATIQGTIGVEHESGVYAGLWGTGLSAGSEIDLYVGYATELSGIGIDIGYVNYSYSNTADEKQEFTEWGEVYLGLSYDVGVELGATLYKGVMDLDKDSTIVEISLGKDFGMVNVSGLYGVQLDEDSGDDYYSATAGVPFESVKGELSFTYQQSTTDDADAVFALAYTTSF